MSLRLLLLPETWIADHLDSQTAQKLATRAFQAANRVAIGQAKKVRFRSKGRGLDSIENKTNTTGLRFALQNPKEGNEGWLVWGDDRIPAIIDWEDVVVSHGLRHRIKYTRLVRRKASSPKAQGADCEGNRYYVQLVLEGIPHVKKKKGTQSPLEPRWSQYVEMWISLWISLSI